MNVNDDFMNGYWYFCIWQMLQGDALTIWCNVFRVKAILFPQFYITWYRTW